MRMQSLGQCLPVWMLICLLLCLLIVTGCTPTPTATPTVMSAAQRGEALFNGQAACRACHRVADDTVMVGPSLRGIAALAAQRLPNMTAEAYLHDSIVAPNAYLVQGFSAGIMPQTYAEMLTDSERDDLVAYMLTLR